MNTEDFSYANLYNLPFLEQLQERFDKEDDSLDSSWKSFFSGMKLDSEFNADRINYFEGDVRVYHLLNAYRTFGHLKAKVNPILVNTPQFIEELSLENLGFKKEELEHLFPTFGLMAEEKAPLKEIVGVLESIYCGTIGIEYMGYQSPELALWIQKRIESTKFHPQLSIDQKLSLLHLINRAELFEAFLHTKYVGQKRFSLQGAETLIAILHFLIDEGSKNEMDEFIIGMAHRGRLNVLTNILNKSYAMVFSEFEDYYNTDPSSGSGDVKYHKGFSSDILTKEGRKVHVSLTANPSHLESVDPVVEGIVKAKQRLRGDEKRALKQVVPLLIHGDASLAGQGEIYECMQLYKIDGYSTGGTIHIVVNNQIGFTTLPEEGRSTFYATDISRTFSAPVFHVNAEDPEGCIYAAMLAVKIRQLFQCDVFIDLICYRKYGHNEGDEPSFTQPKEYELIRKKSSIREIYLQSLIQNGSIDQANYDRLEREFNSHLHQTLEDVRLKKDFSLVSTLEGMWEKYRRGTKEEMLAPFNTSFDENTLKELVNKITQLPQGLTVHPKLKKLLIERQKMVENDRIDWGLAEHLAFATLLWQKVDIRMSGQDTQRGTFSHRHAVWTDQVTSKKYSSLSHLSEDQGHFDIYNSPLSEFAVLGFEFGYSLADPETLVIWEAQFGDFANGAQVIIDQYICSSEQKWARYSGLVMLLPHGYEGQGSEHSSARIERFLQLTAEDNLQITNPTTPHQFFHLLRRQALRPIRKPLIIFTPKGLLRHPLCVSTLKSLSQGEFQEVLNDDVISEVVSQVYFCSGRIYYDLIEERGKRAQNGMAFIRLEQLYPLHNEKIISLLKKFQTAKEFYWIQEEPENMGAWRNIRIPLQSLISAGKELKYVGRKPSASPAIGSHALHQKEYEEIIKTVFEK